MEAQLRAGIAAYNEGEYHGAHDAWEDHWLELEKGTDDERLLHGLIQFTAAVYHARNRNWSGATGLAASANEYLEIHPSRYRKVSVDDVRAYLSKLAEDPEFIERQRPLRLTYAGEVLTTEALDFEETCIAADIIGEEHGYDETLIELAITYARKEHKQDSSQTFVPLLFDFVREPGNRGIITQRLREHVDRIRTQEGDVSGLFEPSADEPGESS